MCPVCHSGDALMWAPMSGEGRIHSYVVVHRSRIPGFRDRTPYVVACIELAEQLGLRMFANIVDAVPTAVHVDAAVVVTFETVDGSVIPQFRLVEANQ